jgi:ankyrin repeat protein
VVARSSFAYNNDQMKKTNSSDAAVKAKNKEMKEAFWKQYALSIFTKILDKNFRKEDALKKSAKESQKIVDALDQSNQKLTAETLQEPEKLLAKAQEIENLLVSTMSKIFVRNLINDEKRKICLNAYLKDKEENLLIMYGSEEYKKQYFARKLQEKLEKERNEKEIIRKNIIRTLFTPVLVEEIIEKGKERAFFTLYDPYWSLSLDPRTFLPGWLLDIVDRKFALHTRKLKFTIFHKILAFPYKEKFIHRNHCLKLQRNIFQTMYRLTHFSRRFYRMSVRITHFFKCLLHRIQFNRYYQQQQLLAIQADEYYQNYVLKKKNSRLYLLFWLKYKNLSLVYKKTKAALAERRFLICFYTWKDKFVKLKYSKLQLTKLQLKKCVQLQCFIRCFLSRRRVLKLRSKKKIFSLYQIVKAKQYSRNLLSYYRRLADYAERARYNYHFYSLMKFSLQKWKKSYFILLGLKKLDHCRNHYNQRHRNWKWKQFTVLKTKYLTKYAIKIQAVARRYIVWKQFWNYYKWRKGCVKFQSLYRKHRAVYYFNYEIYYYRKAKKIQTVFRGHKIRNTINQARIADIHYAAEHNKYEKLKYYCMKFPELIYLKDFEGNTPLHSAAKNAAKRTMKLLIKHMNLNPNEANNFGYTALHLIIMSNAVHRDEIFEYMLEHGFNDDQLTSTGKSCVLLATENNRINILKKLLDDGHDANLADANGLTPLQSACTQGNVAMVELLMENEANVHQPGFNGTFPLHDCITGANIEILYFLLGREVDVNVSDSLYQQTPLMWACQAGLPDFVRQLILHHADTTLRDYKGQTSAHYAALTNVSDVYHALREADVEFDVIDSEGNTPLHVASYYGTAEMTKNILHGGAFPSYQNDKDGEQPSHIAAKYNQLDILKLLCEYDEFIGRPNYHHQTPLGLAKFHNNRDCAEFLEKHYRMINIIDGRNALGEIWWDKTIDLNILSNWEMTLDSSGNRIYRNKLTDEVTLKPPSVESADLVAKLAKKENRLPLRRVIEMVKEEDDHDDGALDENGEKKKPPTKLTKHAYYLAYKQQNEDIKLMSKEYQTATLITKYARRKLAYIEANRLRLSQQQFRKFRRFYLVYVKPFMKIRQAQKLGKVAVIQRRWRGYISRKKFYQSPNGLYYVYRIRWGKRVLRYKMWSVYCFYKFRTEFQLKVKIKNSFNYTITDWMRILDRLHHKPMRTINVHEEYKFPGTMNLRFYHNTLTGNCFFNKPKEIILFDERVLNEEKERKAHMGMTRKQFFLVVKLQAVMRGHIIRNSYKYLEKAMIICHSAYENYLKSPEKDAHIYNYAVYCLTMEQDIERARPVFLECLRRMQWRGPDIAFVLYSYAIFAMKSHDEDIGDLLHFVDRANAAEKWKYDLFVEKLQRQLLHPSGGGAAVSGNYGDNSAVASPRIDQAPAVITVMKINADGKIQQEIVSDPNQPPPPPRITPFRYGRCYDLAKFGFFRYSATTVNNSYGWECYAICLFLVYKEFTASFDAFMEAFKTDPENLKLRKNFDHMMTFFHGKDKDYKDAIIKTRMRYLADQDNQIEENKRKMRERLLKREISAKRIQKWYKERRQTRFFQKFITAVKSNLKQYNKEKNKNAVKRQNVY